MQIGRAHASIHTPFRAADGAGRGGCTSPGAHGGGQPGRSYTVTGVCVCVCVCVGWGRGNTRACTLVHVRLCAHLHTHARVGARTHTQ